MSRVVMQVIHSESEFGEIRCLPVMKMSSEHLVSESWLDGWDRYIFQYVRYLLDKRLLERAI